MFVSRRGQFTWGQFMGLIVVLVVGVIIILGATKGFDSIFGKVDLLPSDLEAKAQACRLAAQGTLKVDYCQTFTKLKAGGVTHYLNCQDSRLQASLEDVPNVPCGDGYEGDQESAETKCESLGEDEWNSDLVNGKLCVDWGFAPPFLPSGE